MLTAELRLNSGADNHAYLFNKDKEGLESCADGYARPCHSRTDTYALSNYSNVHVALPSSAYSSWSIARKALTGCVAGGNILAAAASQLSSIA